MTPDDEPSTSPDVQTPAPKKQSFLAAAWGGFWGTRWFVKYPIMVAAVLVVLSALGSTETTTEPAAATQEPTVAAASASGATSGPATSVASAGSATAAPTKATATPGSNLTASQQSAVRSANAYLRISGFSRQGLIDQLSSPFGDKYPVADATVAVDSLNVDWNAQAVKSANAYLRISGFSCQGLIDQLSSQYGDKYTVPQARHGATQVGLC